MGFPKETLYHRSGWLSQSVFLDNWWNGLEAFMRLSLLFCFLAMTGYALEIAVTDWKLARVSPRLLTFGYSLGVATLAAMSLLHGRESLIAPSAREWPFVGLMVIASFLAAWAHFAALHEGASAPVLAMFYCVMPMAASGWMFLFTGEIPSARMLLAWLFGAVALYLASTATPA